MGLPPHLVQQHIHLVRRAPRPHRISRGLAPPLAPQHPPRPARISATLPPLGRWPRRGLQAPSTSPPPRMSLSRAASDLRRPAIQAHSGAARRAGRNALNGVWGHGPSGVPPPATSSLAFSLPRAPQIDSKRLKTPSGTLTPLGLSNALRRALRAGTGHSSIGRENGCLGTSTDDPLFIGPRSYNTAFYTTMRRAFAR